MFTRILFSIKRLNHKRLNNRKLKELKKRDLPYPKKLCYPKQIKKILILHFQPGWGDFLYFTGLIHALEKRGLEICIGTSKELVHRFQRINKQLSVIDATVDSAELFSVDCAIDLDWNISKYHDLSYVKKIPYWCVTCSDLLAKLNIFDQFIDFSDITHISKRYAFVVESITHSPCSNIYPAISISPDEENFAKSFLKENNLSPNNFIYLNSVGSSLSRSLSVRQLHNISKVCIERNINVVYYSPNLDLQTINKNIFKPIGKVNFFQLSSIVSQSAGIISPDTSIVHLASIFNIPILAIYCENDYDCFGKSLKSETWAPLSENSIIIDPTDKSRIIAKTIPIYKSHIDFQALTNQFLSRLNFRN